MGGGGDRSRAAAAGSAVRVARLKRTRYYRRHPEALRVLIEHARRDDGNRLALAGGGVWPPRPPRRGPGLPFLLLVIAVVAAALWRWVTLWH